MVRDCSSRRKGADAFQLGRCRRGKLYDAMVILI